METPKAPSNFIRDIVDADIASGKNGGRVHTRFPPEPNGYLHIGHAKAICISFGIARDYRGLCNLRFDDTNPEKEEVEYVDSIREDVRWLGFDWGNREYYASDYFGQLYDHAITLIKKGKAYVCDLSPDEQRQYRGTLIAPGKPSPNRDRPVEENLDLFERMRKGEFPDGSRVLRAKIDMASPNMTMRDPTMYRIKKASHHRTGDTWCIYPMYDFTHCISDSIEGITHSICTLEFENNRPLYDWFLIELGIHRPQQIEFARLNLTHTVLSKRILLKLVQQKTVSGWDDPRMPTISGFRRRGYTPSSIRNFCDQIGVAKFNSTIESVVLENSIREELNKTAPRMMAVLKPLKVVITNYPEGKTEELEAVNNPEDPSAGMRKVPFGREIYIEQDDFKEVPPPKYFRLAPGQEVRLRYAYFVKCEKVIKDPATGEVKEVHCTYDPQTRGGNNPPDGRKVKGTIHWVSAKDAVATEVRLYDHLFAAKDPSDFPEGKDIFVNLNPNSLEILKDTKLEPALGQVKAGERVQFERMGYFFADPKDSKPGKPVFNRIVTLRDTWGKIEKKG
jgi:glutaminyl-tRNA synthetase